MSDLYIPPHVTQRTGSKCQFSNCWAATGAWLHRAATGGTAKVTPEEFKEAAGGGSGNPNSTTGCGTGNEGDLLTGLKKLGVKANLLRLSFDQARATLDVERRAVFAIAVDYDAWPRDKDCMNGNAGPDVNHMVGIISGRPLKVMNPLCEEYQEVGLTAVLKAADKLSRQNGRSGIYITRVLRPVPDQTIDSDKVIADLRAQIEERDDAINEAMTSLRDALASIAPYERE